VKKTLWLTCLAVLVSTTSFAAQAAETPKAAAKPAAAAKAPATAKAPAGPVMTAKEKAAFAKQVDLFTQVAAAGETEKDPLLLLSAVKMLDQLPFGGIVREGAQEKGAYDRDALLSSAKEYAAGDAELLAVIAKLQDAPEATAVRGYRHHGDGPGYYYDRRYHERHYGCDWHRVCGRRGCDWVCDEGYRERYRERERVREIRRRR
jgi:hypothetical protein